MTTRKALLFIAVITIWRIVWLAFDRTDLFVDEAQYWLWSQHPDFGYYSKPPVIAWIIGAVTGLAGSDSVFFIRLSGPLLHAANALMLMAATRRIADARIAAWVGASYIAIPAVALSSYMFSTDVPLVFFLALTLFAYLGLTQQRSVWLALLMGAGVGFAFLSKYAVLFLLPGGAVALLLVPEARIAVRDFLIAVATSLVVAAPNLLWNLMNGGATVRHTESIARWDTLAIKPLKGLEFFAAQFGVMGPVLFAALIWATVRALGGKSPPMERLLVLLSAPVVLLITLQAFVAKAEANWAASAYVAGTVVAVLLLAQRRPVWLKVSLAITGVAALMIAVLPAFPTLLPVGLVTRNLGRSEISLKAADLAREAHLATIVSDNRDMLADLFHTLAGDGFSLKARAPAGFPDNYYEQMFPYPRSARGEGDGTDAAPVLLLTRKPLACPRQEPKLLASWVPESGYYHGRTIYAYQTQAGCLEPVP